MSKKAPKVGGVELDMGLGVSPYIPQNAQKFIDHSEILKTLAIGISNNLPVLMIGESGTGKTSAIRYLAGITQNGLRRVNLNGGTTADELVGRLLAKDGSTYWVDGILTEAMRNGDWILFDEINAALPEVLFVLQSVMDDDGYLVLTEKDDKEIVHKHPNFRIFAGCNPPEYAGTKEMNKALLSRFPICINAEYPPEKKEMEIIENHLGNAMASSDIAQKMVMFARETRAAKENNKADFAINTRDVLNALKLIKYMDPTEAICIAFANKLDMSDTRALRALARTFLPMAPKKKKGEIRQVMNFKDIAVHGEYKITADMHNVLCALTNKKPEIAKLLTSNLGNVLSQGLVNLTKNDRFKVLGYYYSSTDGVKVTEEKDIKIASLVEMLDGAHKGLTGVLIHHKDLENSDRILPHLYEEI